MTSIAFDGKKLVSDSQATAGMIIQPGGLRKIHEPEEGEYWDVQGHRVLAAGISGDGKSIEVVKEKLRTGVTHKTKIDDIDEIGFAALLITEAGQCYRWQVNKRQGRPLHTDLLHLLPPAAAGSGQTYVLGVLSIGKSAEAAIRAAIRLDKYSGGDLQIWEVPPTPAIKSTRPVVVAEATPA
jgi:hypothetical protein